MDETSIGLLVGGGVFLLLMRTLLGIADSNLVLISRSRLKQMAEEGNRGSQMLETLLDDRHRLHASLALFRTSMSVLLGAITVWVSLAYFANSRSAQMLTLLAVLLVTLFMEMLARRIAWVDPEQLGSRLAIFYVVVNRCALPFVMAFGAVAHLVSGTPPQAREREVSGEDIRLLVEAGHDIEESEKEMIHSIFELSETLAREIMVPRVDVVAADVNWPLNKVLELSLEHGLSRMPVYEGTVDNVVGLVYAKDLLPLLKDGRMDTPLRQLLRPPHFVPGSKKVDELLRELQHAKISMAIVVDEYGGTDGLITMEDLIEEIVGEIADEYDKDVQTVELLKDGSVSLDAKMIIEDVNEKLGTSLPADEYETIGGYVYGLLGHVPREGETMAVDGLTIQVEAVQRQRITKVRIVRQDETAFVLQDGAATVKESTRA